MMSLPVKVTPMVQTPMIRRRVRELPRKKDGKKKKAKSPITPKDEIVKRANQMCGRVKKKMTTEESVKQKSGHAVKKAGKNGKGMSKTIVGSKAKKTKNNRSAPQTPDRKVTSQSANSTPSTITSNSTTSSKRAVVMMNSLELKTPPKKAKTVQAIERAIDYEDASEIDWVNLMGVDKALTHFYEDASDLRDMDYGEKIVLLCTNYKPNDIRAVYQGIHQEAGKNWRDLKLAKHRTMKSLSAEFSKTCIDLYNARAELAVPGKIAIKKENVGYSANA